MVKQAQDKSKQTRPEAKKISGSTEIPDIEIIETATKQRTINAIISTKNI